VDREAIVFGAVAAKFRRDVKRMMSNDATPRTSRFFHKRTASAMPLILSGRAIGDKRAFLTLL
jgi:hypothetical protein